MANTPTLPNTDDYVAACPPVTVTLGDVTLDVDATGVTSEQFCTPECETVTVFYCKDDGVLGIEPIAHIPPGSTATVAGPYPGELADCGPCNDSVKAPQWLPGCRNGCEPAAYCLDADGVVLQWRDAEGTITLGDPGDISPGECPTAIPECVRVWSADAGDATLEAETMSFVSIAGTFFNLADGSKGDKADLLAQYGLTPLTGFCTPCDVSKNSDEPGLVPCPVAAPENGVWETCTVHELSLIACIPDCPEPGDPDPEPVTVTWKGVTRTVAPGDSWSTPPATCDPIEGEIVVTGEVRYDQAWTLGESTGECE